MKGDPDTIVHLMDRLRKGESASDNQDAAILPLVAPEEAIAIALSMTQPGPAKLISPDGPMVRQVMLSLKLAGHRVVPR